MPLTNVTLPNMQSPPKRRVAVHWPSCVATDEGGVWRLTADKSDHESLNTVQPFLGFVEAEVWWSESSVQRSEALVMSDRPSCRGFGRMDV